MIGEQTAKAILDKVLYYASTADQAEALLSATENHLTRFANSAIHQNVSEDNASLHIRVVLGRRIGESSTNDLRDDSVQAAVSKALDIARLQAENVDFVSLPSPSPIEAVTSYSPATANCAPEDRARSVGIICQHASAAGLSAAGACSTGVEEIAVANSLGINAYHCQTSAEASTVVMSEDSSGYAHRVSLDVSDIDFEAIAMEAVHKALSGRNPVPIPHGEYEVVLEPYAVQDILGFLAYLGLNALALREQRSFMGGHFGERLVGDNVHIYDDALDTTGLPVPFDFEGVPKQRVDFFERGIAKAVVYDSYLAFLEGKQSTGHALPSSILNGPLPLNMFMAPGSASEEDLVKSVKRGLRVTRFWYTRPVEPLKVIVTGMTRDGTFLIENGEIVGPVRNLRFTQGYLDALSNVEAISRETRLVREEGPVFKVPSLKISRWNFVSATEY